VLGESVSNSESAFTLLFFCKSKNAGTHREVGSLLRCKHFLIFPGTIMFQRKWLPASLLAVFLMSCASPDAFVKEKVASEVMAPPNGGRNRISPKIAEFNPLQYDAAYTVEVGPPPATLAYWVTNPTPERLAMLRPPEWVLIDAPVPAIPRVALRLS
jgi:hypothetical protein